MGLKTSEVLVGRDSRFFLRTAVPGVAQASTSPLPSGLIASGPPLRPFVLDVIIGQALYVCTVDIHYIDFPVAVAVALEGDSGAIG